MSRYRNNLLVLAGMANVVAVFTGLISESVIWTTVGITSMVYWPIVWSFNRTFDSTMESLTAASSTAVDLQKKVYKMQTQVQTLSIELTYAQEQTKVWQDRAKELMMEKGVPIPDEMMLNRYPFDHPIWGHRP
jgi:hypothetical protein